jgi:hypothetical protein
MPNRTIALDVKAALTPQDKSFAVG